MKVAWTNLPKGLKLVITTSNGAAYPKIIGSPEALDRWMPRLQEMQAGNPASISIDDTGVTFSSMMALPNQMQMLTLFGSESGVIQAELSEVLADDDAVRWALANGWVTAEDASILLEAYEPIAEPVAEPAPQGAPVAPAEAEQQQAQAQQSSLDVDPEEDLGTTVDVEPHSEVSENALIQDDERLAWIDLSAYGMRLALRETDPAYQAQGGAESLPLIEADQGILQTFRTQLEALGMTVMDNNGQLTVFCHSVEEIPSYEAFEAQFPMINLTEVSLADIERPRGVDYTQASPVIDFDKVDFGPMQDAMVKGLLSRAKRALQGDTSIAPIDDQAMIDLASRYTGIAPSLFSREITNFSMRDLQENLEAAAVRAARELASTAISDGQYDPSLAEARITALVSTLPKMDIRTGESQTLMQFSTPLHMGLLAQKTLGIKPGDSRSVWEPTMGNGALLTLVDPKNISGIELDASRVARLKAQGINAIHGNAIDTTAVKARSQDVIVMNPPFGQLPDEHRKGAKGLTYYNILNSKARMDLSRQDHWITLKHLDAMKDDGKAFIILGAESPMKYEPGQMSSKSNRFRQMIHDTYEVVGEAWVSGDLYKQQGAAWPLHIIAINGRREDLGDVRFEEQLPTIHSMDEMRDLLDQWSISMGELDLNIPGMPEQSEKSTRTPGQSDPKDSQKQVDPLTGMALPEEDRSKEDPSEAVDLDEAEPEESAAPVTEDPEPEEVAAEDLPEIAEDAPPAPVEQPQEVSEPADDKEIGFEDKMVPYVPASKLKSLEKLVPANLAAPIQKTLRKLKRKHGDIDDFVAAELGWTHEHLSQVLSAEQADAVAMAIDKARTGRGIVLGDKTGVGKGRIVATMISWASKNGIRPVFLTETAGLFEDMVRDLKDIGEFDRIKPLITNHDAKVKDQADREVVWRGIKSSEFKAIRNSSDLGEYNAIFSTYSQFNRPMEKSHKAQWLLQAAWGSLVIMDESHNAAGAGTNTGNNMAAALDVAQGAMYASATWSKNPKNMGVYAYKTSLAAGTSPEEVIETITQGGIAAQEAAATMLADGEYIARAHPVNYLPELEVVPEYSEKHDLNLRDIGDKMSRVYDMFLFLSGQTQETAQKENKAIAQEIERMPEEERQKAQGWSVDSIMFASRMWQFEKLMNYITLSAHAVDKAIDEHKKGRKPFIAVDSTMEAFITELQAIEMAEASNEGRSTDQLRTKASFQSYMMRYLPKLVTVKRMDRYGNVEEASLFDIEDMRTRWLNDELPSDTDDSEEKKVERMAIAFFETEELIKEFPEDLPISPVDWIRHKLTEAGLNVVEGTGRQIGLDYSVKGDPIFFKRSKEDMDKSLAISQFNSGEADVLIGNRSIFTGFSMHASTKFKDQRERSMLFLDPPLDPNKVVQAMGRIDRTGAVEGTRPHFTFLASPMPGAKRPVANLIRKLAGLNASTTGDRNVDLEGLGEDLFNEVGDLAVLEVLTEREDGYRMLRKLNFNVEQEIENQAGYKLAGANTGLARRFTGRMVALPVAKQEELYDQFENRFRENLQQLESEGRNPLRSHVLDLRAETVESFMIEPATGTSSFQSGVDAEVIEYEVPYHPVHPETVHKTIAETRSKAMARGDADCKPLKHVIGAIAAKMVGQEVQRLRKLYPDVEWDNQDKRRHFLNNLMNANEHTTYPSKKHEAAVKIFQKNSDLFNRVESIAEMLAPGMVVQDYPLDNTRYTNSSTTLLLGGIQPANDPSHLGSWNLRFYSTDPEVGAIDISLNQLLTALDGDTGTNIQSEIASSEMIDMIFDADAQEQQTFKAQRVVLTGNLFKAHSKANSMGAGRIGAYTDKKGYKHLGVIMPSHWSVTELQMAVKKTSFSINDSQTAADYYRNLVSERPDQAVLYSRQAYAATFEDSSNKHKSNEVGSGVILQHQRSSGGVRIIISGIKKYNQALIKDKKLKEFLNSGDFEQESSNKRFMSAYLKPNKTVEELMAHLIKHHGMAFAGNPMDREWYNDYMETKVQLQRDIEADEDDPDDEVEAESMVNHEAAPAA
ncbi:MAG: strawberry notch C-terminal domain-containing protein [Marinospirillum sp.]|uniref:strawberry notch C-terminal domain-containing protein n=1 Tax=Marinospirillum sp. TaxID=2183934 RepID=UPI001A0A7991|nr:strawberry notch C-terminal domain-containing protein [Marinospirillum sp.]MBE0506073.1 strawberry notch C-terminal domain-containing protein [Marinospirillum sp.]